jgi:hypothetical protein
MALCQAFDSRSLKEFGRRPLTFLLTKAIRVEFNPGNVLFALRGVRPSTARNWLDQAYFKFSLNQAIIRFIMSRRCLGWAIRWPSFL